MTRKIEISHRTIIFTFLLIASIWFFFQIRQIFFLIFIAIILMSALNPAVDKLQQFKFPRSLSIGLLYALIISIFSSGIAGIIPPLVEQTSILVSQVPALVKIVNFSGIDAADIATQLSQISRIPGDIVKFTAGLFSNILLIFSVSVLTFYLLLERPNLKTYLKTLFNSDDEKKVENFINKLEAQLGSWVRGELILMSTIGLFTFVGLTLLGVPYALPLSIIAGILEVVPTFGPVISAIPAILAGLLISPYTAIAVTALYFVVQQTENSFLVPKIMERATGVNPLISLISLMIGFDLAGPGGAVLAIPIVLVIKVIFTEFFSGSFGRP